MNRSRCGLLAAVLLSFLSWSQPEGQAPAASTASDVALQELVDAERAFAALAQRTNFRDAFLEYFVDGMRGFEGEDIKAQLRGRPAPPADLEFWWEPRYGDLARSGELGWLTGPVRRRLPSRNSGKPSFSNYASIWKRQADGRFKVILDVGVDIPELAPFAPGFTRVPMPSRYTGPDAPERASATLREADESPTRAAQRDGLARAYGQTMAPFVRLHRGGRMPMTTSDAARAWLETRPAWSGGDTRVAEVARSGDLGYTWGTYSSPAAGPPTAEARPVSAEADPISAEAGHYVRVWSRDAAGRWWLVLDILQPRPPA